MKKIDVLKGINEGVLTLDEAEVAYDAVMDSDPADAPNLLGLSKVEWAAYAKGVWFDELAEWTTHGWPTRCAKCGILIVVEDYGWSPFERSDGKHELRHVVCPKPE